MGVHGLLFLIFGEVTAATSSSQSGFPELSPLTLPQGFVQPLHLFQDRNSCRTGTYLGTGRGERHRLSKAGEIRRRLERLETH
jgi:hypothetical protein